MPKITELYAWVMADEDEDDEGIPATRMGDVTMPLMGSDLSRAQSLRPLAQMTADAMGKPIKLIKSTGIQTIEVVKPK